MSTKETKRAPDLQYSNTEYSNVHKHFQMPDGTIVIYNPEAGNESLTIYHSSGSYHEYRGTGTVVQLASNNHIMYQKGGFTLSVDNNSDVKIAGHARLLVDGDLHAEVAKNASIVMNGMGEVISRGHLKFAAADIEMTTTQGSIVMNAARDVEVKADKGRILQHSSGVHQITTDVGDMHVEVGGDVHQISINNTRTASANIVDIATQIDLNP